MDPRDPQQPVVDYSADFRPLRTRLQAETGGEYLRFVAGLAPRHGRAWRDVALGYAFLAAVLCATGLPQALPAQLLAVAAGGLAVGYGVAFLQLFLHEAAHYQLAADRSRNDRLCDALISWQVGTTVADYRPIHFAHHRRLGTRQDTENSYFRSLGPRLLLETLTGIHALRILLHRRRRLAERPVDDGAPGRRGAGLARGVVLHGLVTALAWRLSGWPGVAAWVLGVGIAYPLFATVRQLLEHRDAAADPRRDYAATDHGAVTRLFGDGPLASTLGGAGFNRHLLHHWEPQVSCTRLAELERYLEGTSAAAVMTARRTTYGRAFAELWRASR